MNAWKVAAKHHRHLHKAMAENNESLYRETRKLEAINSDLLAACEFTMNNINYLQNLWGKEGVTDNIKDRLYAAIRNARGKP